MAILDHRLSRGFAIQASQGSSLCMLPESDRDDHGSSLLYSELLVWPSPALFDLYMAALLLTSFACCVETQHEDPHLPVTKDLSHCL